MVPFATVAILLGTLWMVYFVHRRIRQPRYGTRWWVSFWCLLGAGFILGLLLCIVQRTPSDTLRLSGWPFVVAGTEQYQGESVTLVARHMPLPVVGNVFAAIATLLLPVFAAVWKRERLKQSGE